MSESESKGREAPVPLHEDVGHGRPGAGPHQEFINQALRRLERTDVRSRHGGRQELGFFTSIDAKDFVS